MQVGLSAGCIIEEAIQTVGASHDRSIRRLFGFRQIQARLMPTHAHRDLHAQADHWFWLRHFGGRVDVNPFAVLLKSAAMFPRRTGRLFIKRMLR